MIDRPEIVQAIAAFHQDFGIAGKTGNVAGDGDNAAHIRFGELARLQRGQQRLIDRAVDLFLVARAGEARDMAAGGSNQRAVSA